MADHTRSAQRAAPLLLIFGLLVMHALVAFAHVPVHSGQPLHSAVSAAGSFAEGTDPLDLASPSADAAQRDGVPASGMPASHSSVDRVHLEAPKESVSPVASATAADRMSTDPMTDLGHACLAVLATVAIVLAALLVWSGGSSTGASARLGRAVVGLLPRPPPTSVRLAQLCVLRN